jgi:hypothetical protein
MSRLARPHWIDPTTNIIYDTNSADFEGWLTKQSMWLKVRLTRSTFFSRRYDMHWSFLLVAMNS